QSKCEQRTEPGPPLAGGALRRAPPASAGLRRATLGHDCAEDVVAEVFATAWRRRDAVPDAPLAWLFQVARNHVRHEYRSKGRRSRLQDLLALHRPDTADDHSRVEVDSVLDHLSPDDAEILRLTIWEELTPS